MENYLHDKDKFWLTFEGMPQATNMRRIRTILPWLPYRIKKDIMADFCKIGNMDDILWLHSQKFPLGAMCYYYAISKNNMTLIEWLYENNCPSLYDPLRTAIEYQRDEIYKWFQKKGYDRPIRKTIRPEHRANIKLVRSGQLSHISVRGGEMEDLIFEAVWHNNFKFYKKYPRYKTDKHIGDFYKHGNFKAVKYLISPENIYREGIAEGRKYLLKLAIKRKNPPPDQNDGIWQHAMKHGPKFMKFITKHFGIIFDPCSINSAIDCACNLETIKWAVTAGHNIDDIMHCAPRFCIMDLFLWGISQNMEIDKRMLTRWGSPEMIIWAYEHNVLKWPDGYKHFVYGNDFESIQKYCTFVDDTMIECAIKHGQIEILKFFAERCSTWPAYAEEIARDSHHFHLSRMFSCPSGMNPSSTLQTLFSASR